MARSISPALATLSGDASSRARTPRERVSPRQIERWIAEELHPGLDRRWAGGGGSSSSYDEDLVDLTVQVAQAVAESEAFDEAALILWIRGLPIPEQRFRTAYAGQIRRVESRLRSLALSDDPADIAEALALQLVKRSSLQAKTWRRRLRARRARIRHEREQREREERSGLRPPSFEEPRDGEDPVGSVLQSAGFTAVFAMLTGEASSCDGLLELFEATGIAAVARDHLPGQPPAVTDLLDGDLPDILSVVRIDALIDRLHAMTSAELETARADNRMWRDFARTFAAYARRVLDFPDAFGYGPLGDLSDITFAYAVPLAAWLRDVLPQQTAAFMPFLAAHLDRYAAANRLLDSVPERLHYAFAPGVDFHALPTADQALITDVATRFRQDDPEGATLVDTWSSVPELQLS